MFVRLLLSARPLASLPVWIRYGLTVLVVLAGLLARWALDPIYPYPYLVFLPGILLASFVFDRGSGIVATLLSAALALYFFVEPTASFEVRTVGQLLSVVIFVGVGLLSASLIEALRSVVESLAEKEARLAQSLNLLETVIESATDPMAVKDREGRFVRANSSLARVLGVPLEGLIGRRLRDLVPAEQAEAVERAERAAMEARGPQVIEEQLPVEGSLRWFLTTKAPWYGPDGTIWGLVSIGRDIEERKRGEEAMREASGQKDLLLSDINHRIKNHLQSVISALSISRRQMPDEASRAAVANTIARLTVLARVYDRLQLRSGGEAVVSARDFIEGLCAELAPALIDLRPIALKVSIVDEPLELGRAVCVGLAVNEALTNALKYAFPDERAGTVLVLLEREDGMFRLEVADDGIGHDPQAACVGIGNRLMRSLAQQLGGTLQICGERGTRVMLRFPPE